MVFMPWRLSVQILQQTPDTFIPFNRSLHTQIVYTIESKPNRECVFFNGFVIDKHFYTLTLAEMFIN